MILVSTDVEYVENPVVELKVIWDEPLTNPLPPNIWDEPLITPSAFNFDLIVVFIDDVNDSKLDVSVSNVDNRVRVEPLNVFKFVNETPCESFVVLAVDAEAINEPVIVANALFWVSCEPLNEFNESSIPITWDEPLTTPLVAAIAPLIEVAYTFLYTLSVLPKSNAFVTSGIIDELKSAFMETLSVEESPIVMLPPNVKLPWIFASPVISNPEPEIGPKFPVLPVPVADNKMSPSGPPINRVPNVVFTYGSPNANEPDCCAVVPRLNLSAI